MAPTELQFIMFGSLAPIDSGYRSTAAALMKEFGSRIPTECICVLPRNTVIGEDTERWCSSNRIKLTVLRLPGLFPAPVGNGVRGFLVGSIPGYASNFRRLLRKSGVHPLAEKSILYFTLGWDPFLAGIARWLGDRHVVFPADSISLMEEGRARLSPSIQNLFRAFSARHLERKSLRGGRCAYVYVSSDDANRARELAGSGALPRIQAVPIGVSDFVTEERTAAERAQARGNIISFTGALNHPPNRLAAERLITRIAPLVEGVAFTTQVAGRGGDSLKHLCSEHVQVYDWLPNLSELISRTQIFVAAVPFGAGMKNNVLRAMASGVPVIGTEAAFAGFGVVPPGCRRCETDAEFASTIALFLSDRNMIDEAGAQARAFVLSRFSWKQSVDRLVSLYHHGHLES